MVVEEFCPGMNHLSGESLLCVDQLPGGFIHRRHLSVARIKITSYNPAAAGSAAFFRAFVASATRLTRGKEPTTSSGQLFRLARGDEWRSLAFERKGDGN